MVGMVHAVLQRRVWGIASFPSHEPLNNCQAGRPKNMSDTRQIEVNKLLGEQLSGRKAPATGKGVNRLWPGSG
jgi:hypothetical protein